MDLEWDKIFFEIFSFKGKLQIFAELVVGKTLNINIEKTN